MTRCGIAAEIVKMDFSKKRVLLLGFGGEARAALSYIKTRYPSAEVSVADQSTSISFSNAESEQLADKHLGAAWLESIPKYDIVIRTPGVPLHAIPDLSRSSTVVTTGTNIFLERHAAKTWAVTGTNGKSTTSSLLHHVLTEAGIKSIFGGNIGVPALSLIDEPCDLFVLELSSYQLEDCAFSPHGAIFLNLYEEHLDHHRTMDLYGAAKARIAINQNSDGVLVISTQRDTVSQLTASSPARRRIFGVEDAFSWVKNDHFWMRTSSGDAVEVCHVDAPKLKGPGNRQNILAVLAALGSFPVSSETIARSLRTFSPLPHRLEEIGTIGGVGFVNDSISTVPEATINALETFGPKVKTLILGGFDRGVSFEHFADYLMTTAVDTILFFPPSGARIQAAITRRLEASGRRMQFYDVKDMPHAITLACTATPEGHLCLLSPASPSFPLFKNFEERGALFKKAVLSVTGE